jgi:hypothetical protein
MTRRLIKTPMNIRISTSNMRKRNRFFLETNPFLKNTTPVPTPEPSIPHEVKDKVMSLVNKKYDLCVE